MVSLFALIFISISFIAIITKATTEYRCSDDQACIIDCNSLSACADTSIYCPINQDCTVKCNNQYSCSNAIIYAQHSKYLSVTVQAQISNAANMKIYTPSPNYMKQKSVMTCNSDEAQDQYRDEDDTGTNTNTLNHCNDISIYTTQGFDEIDLKCNDDSSLCDISGSIYCDDLNDECESFAYNDIDYKYECQETQFCSTSTPSLSPTLSGVAIPSSRPTDRANINPTVPEQEEQDNETLQVQKATEEEDIDTLYIVIIGTLAILCVVLSVAGICGFCYVRMNRESVEETIVKRYIADRGRGRSRGRGAALNNEIAPCTNINTNTTSTGSNVAGEDDDNFGSKESKVGSLVGDGIIYGDAGSENISSFDDDDLNKILDMDLNASPNGTESSLGLGLTATFPVAQSSQSRDSDNKQNMDKNKSKKVNINLSILIKGNKSKNKNKNIINDKEGNDTYDQGLECDIDKYDDINMFEDDNINDNMTSNPLNNIHRFQQNSNSMSAPSESHIHSPSNSPSNLQDGHDSFSTSTYIDGDSEDIFDFEQEELKIEREMGLISANTQQHQQYHHQHSGHGSGYIDINIITDGSGVICYGNPNGMNMTSTPISHSDEYKIVYTDNMSMELNDCHHNTTQQHDCIKCNLPVPPPPAKKLQLYLQTDVPLTDKQKEIQLENIKNRAKCYGYQQAQILFEDDENFSDDSDDSHKAGSSLDHDKKNKKTFQVGDKEKDMDKSKATANSVNSVHSPSKKLNISSANNDSNSKYLKVITQTLKQQRDQSMTMTTIQTQTRTRDRSLSNSRSMGQRKPSVCSVATDDLLEEHKSFEKMEIKIHFPEEEDIENNNHEQMTPITPCSSDTRKHDERVRDPEILSDDEELPTLPANSPISNHDKTTFGHPFN